MLLSSTARLSVTAGASRDIEGRSIPLVGSQASFGGMLVAHRAKSATLGASVVSHGILVPQGEHLTGTSSARSLAGKLCSMLRAFA